MNADPLIKKVKEIAKQNKKWILLGSLPIKDKKKYRNRLLIRASKSMTIQNNLSKALKNFKIQPEIKLTVDVDPISFN